ncbi:MAG: CDP-diacylglycerol--serine O-phosphatidyltransferase [Deltaproteobacteria bacterium]|nr:MAG: CDP-diacylglycerol--serine O-phosphatidyltransferase [Deltaproteobacteria bacterium]
MKVDLKKSLFILPNLFTLSSVLCGYYAILILSGQPTGDDFYRSAILIVFALFFDGIDGRVARLTKTQSAIGVQLDSLADMISFGVAPAVLVYRWSLTELGTGGMLVGFVFVATGAIRLARFNVASTGDDGQPHAPAKYTQGLPIPAAAGILISIVVANHLTGKLPFTPILISVLVVTLSVFMVSAMPFRSFKDLKLNWRTVAFVSVTICVTVWIALKIHPSMALVWLLAAYVVIGIVESLIALMHKARAGIDKASRRST